MSIETYTADTVPEGFPPETRKTEFIAFNAEGREVGPEDKSAVRAAVTYFDAEDNAILISDMVVERGDTD